MRSVRHRASRLCLVSLATLVGSGLSAQPDGASRFGEVVDVDLINVEVWVSDRQGRAVTGLRREDFRVREDGETVPISHFAEVRGASRGRSPDPERSLPESGPAAGAAQSSPVAGEAGRGHLVVYFDQLRLRPASRKQVVGDLRRFLRSERLPPDRVLLLAQGNELVIEAPFGSDQAGLDSALARLASTTGGGVGIELERSLALRRLQQLWQQARELSTSPCPWFLRRAGPEVESYSRQNRDRLAITLNHLSSTASFLAGVPGLKTLVYVSDSLELHPGTELLSFVDGLCPEQRDITRFDLAGELSEPFRQLTRHANTNRVTLYTVQALGLQSGFLTTADQPAVDLRGTRNFESTLRNSQRDGLFYVASETGGRAILNRNRFGGELEAIAEEMTTYYSLAYAPTHGGDGAEHRIEVDVAGDGLRVRHRRGYRDKGPDERMADRLESALYLGLMSNPLQARLGAGTVRRGTGGKFILPLHVLVAADRVAFLPSAAGLAAGQPTARLKLQVAAADERNRNVAFEQRVFRFEQPVAPQARRTPAASQARRTSVAPQARQPPTAAEADPIALLDLAVDLELDHGVYVIAAALRDKATLETSYLSTTLEVQIPKGRKNRSP